MDNKSAEMRRIKKSRTSPAKFIVLFCLLFLMMILSLFIGQYKATPLEIVRAVLGYFSAENSGQSTILSIIWNIRLPRILAAVLIGGSLSLAGATYQGVYRNYLVSQDVLGVSSGACLGASIAIVCGLSSIFIQSFAFIAGMISILLTASLSLAFKNAGKTLSLVLSGILIAGLMTSLLGLVKYIANPETQLQSIIFWTMGSLSSITMLQLAYILIPVALCVVILLLFRWKLTLFSFNDREAQSIGINIVALRYVTLICATVLIACSISIAGSIGWIGLVMPQIARLLCGSDNKDVLPVAFITGSIFLLFIDMLVRQFFTAEIPIGIFTGIVGTPLFIGCLLYRFVWRK